MPPSPVSKRRSVLKDRQSIAGFQSNDCNVLEEDPFELKYYNTFKNQRKRVRWEKHFKTNLESSQKVVKKFEEPNLQPSDISTTFENSLNTTSEYSTMTEKSMETEVTEELEVAAVLTGLHHNLLDATSILEEKQIKGAEFDNKTYRIVQVTKINKRNNGRKKRKKIGGYRKKSVPQTNKTANWIRFKSLKRPICTTVSDFLTYL